jgi:hypothetical protein
MQHVRHDPLSIYGNAALHGYLYAWLGSSMCGSVLPRSQIEYRMCFVRTRDVDMLPSLVHAGSIVRCCASLIDSGLIALLQPLWPPFAPAIATLSPRRCTCIPPSSQTRVPPLHPAPPERVTEPTFSEQGMRDKARRMKLFTDARTESLAVSVLSDSCARSRRTNSAACIILYCLCTPRG